MVSELAVSEYSRIVLEIQVLRPQPIPTVSMSPGIRPRNQQTSSVNDSDTYSDSRIAALGACQAWRLPNSLVLSLSGD